MNSKETKKRIKKLLEMYESLSDTELMYDSASAFALRGMQRQFSEAIDRKFKKMEEVGNSYRIPILTILKKMKADIVVNLLDKYMENPRTISVDDVAGLLEDMYTDLNQKS